MKQNLLVTLVVILLLSGSTIAGNYASTQEGLEGVVTFSHSQACDSAKFYFGFDGDGTGDASGNLYEVVKLSPINDDSTTLFTDSLNLDSIGTHLVEVYYWEAGADSISEIGSWLHSSLNVDSAVHSRVNRRTIWGAVASSGDDSVAAPDRHVNTASLSTGAITAAAIATDAIGSAEIAADAIGASEIATDAIGAAELAANAIGSSEIATDAVDADAIADNSIDVGAIASGAITSSEIATDAIGSDEIALNAIGASEIADGAIDAGALAADAITEAKIADNAIAAEHIATDAIGASELAANAIGASEIATDAIDADALATDAIDEHWEYDSSLVTSTSGVGNALLTGADTSLYASSSSIAGETADSVKLELDTVLTWLGFGNTSNSKADKYSDQDTLWTMRGTDTMGYTVYFHPGGSAGDPPDSTKSYEF